MPERRVEREFVSIVRSSPRALRSRAGGREARWWFVRESGIGEQHTIDHRNLQFGGPESKRRDGVCQVDPRQAARARRVAGHISVVRTDVRQGSYRGGHGDKGAHVVGNRPPEIRLSRNIQTPWS